MVSPVLDAPISSPSGNPRRIPRRKKETTDRFVSAPSGTIQIRGARENNLKNVNLDIKRNSLTCFCGPSGSGKTSLVFRTLYSESKRIFLNSFPSYLKFFSDRPVAAAVDKIAPTLPAFGLPQINPVMGARSTVSDVMGLTELWQTLFFYYARPYCPHHRSPLEFEDFPDAVERYCSLEFQNAKSSRPKTFHLFLKKEDFERLFPTGPFPIRSLTENSSLHSFDSGDPYWEVARFRLGRSQAVSDYSDLIPDEELLKLGHVIWEKDSEKVYEFFFRGQWSCPEGDQSLETVAETPQAFSPYNALGACPECSGHGALLDYNPKLMLDLEKSVKKGQHRIFNYKRFRGMRSTFIAESKAYGLDTDCAIQDLPQQQWSDFLWKGHGKYPGLTSLLKKLEKKRYRAAVRIYLRSLQSEIPCKSCHGSRLAPDSGLYAIEGNNESYLLEDLSVDSLESAFKILAQLVNEETELKKKNDRRLSFLKMNHERLDLAMNLGLGHLQLNRKTKTLSSGEYQRLLLLKYLGHEGTDCMFIFDEPSVGLGPEEQEGLCRGLRKIQAQGNTVIIVDHNPFLQKMADEIVVMGPAAGPEGGHVVYQGAAENCPPELNPSREINLDTFTKDSRVHDERHFIEVHSAEVFDFCYPDFSFPLNEMISVLGPSGSGKSSCFLRCLADDLSYKIHGEHLIHPHGSAEIKGAKTIKDVFVVDADLNRRTGRSTVGSLTELASLVRRYFLKLPVSVSMGLQEGHFSSNSQLGMCSHCGGRGDVIIEMQFLEDITLSCEYCDGFGLRPDFANISDGTMTVREAFEWPMSRVLTKISLTPKFQRIWQAIQGLQLSYLGLSRQMNSLSGGEKQRLLLLGKILRPIEGNLILFENLSFGLSQRDLQQVMSFLRQICEKGNTLIFIDQNPMIAQFATYRLQFDKYGGISQN